MAEREKVLVAATTNAHKIAELAAVLGGYGYRIVSRAEAGVPEFDVEESGATFEENSLIKARAIFDWLGGEASVVADDSGLAVDALGGAPGVYSARFAGQEDVGAYAAGSDGDAADFAAALADEEQAHRGLQDRANNAKLIRLLADVPAQRRTARFVSVITCLRPNCPPIVCRGEVEGLVDFRETGRAGFGYDPLFVPLGYGKSFGLFAPEDKNAISHRGRALAMLAEKIGALDWQSQANPVPEKTKDILSSVFGILSLIDCFAGIQFWKNAGEMSSILLMIGFLGIPGIVFGIVGIVIAKHNKEKRRTTDGFTLSVIGVCFNSVKILGMLIFFFVVGLVP